MMILKAYEWQRVKWAFKIGKQKLHFFPLHKKDELLFLNRLFAMIEVPPTANVPSISYNLPHPCTLKGIKLLMPV